MIDGTRRSPSASSAPSASPHATDDRDRAAYLDEVCELLWPRPARAAPAPPSSPGRVHSVTAAADHRLLVLPSRRHPRLLVPARRRPAAAAVRRYGEPASLPAYLGTRALWLALAAGAGQRFVGDVVRLGAPADAPTIESYLSAQLDRDVEVSMHLGTARANRKPVLQLLSPGGSTVGFAKIGTNPLTRRLVRAEQRSLTRLGRAGLDNAAVPSVLHFGTWHGLDVLILSPLPVWHRRRRLQPGQLSGAMREVAQAAGVSVRPLAASPYWAALRSRVASADGGADQAALARALAGIGERSGSAELTFGAWHGDWTPWNMACTRQALLVWDWERYTEGVPVGFDVLHCWLQTQVTRRSQAPRAAASACLAQAPALLRPLEADPDRARLTAILYLAELSARYLEDRQAAVNPRLGTPGNWLIPALTEGTARL